MFKKRYFSPHDNFKTGFLCKFTLFIGLILLITFIFFKISSIIIGEEETGIFQNIYEISQSSIMDSIIAFSIIFLGVGVIFYFFQCQFAKLAKIADEIECDEDLIENNNT